MLHQESKSKEVWVHHVWRFHLWVVRYLSSQRLLRSLKVVRYYKWLVTTVMLRLVLLTTQVRMTKDGQHLSYYLSGQVTDMYTTLQVKVGHTSVRLVMLLRGQTTNLT